MAAHAVGYVGEVSEAELNTPEFARFHQGDVIGKDGIERQYNDILMGVDGQRRVIVNSVGREVGRLRMPVDAEHSALLVETVEVGLLCVEDYFQL